MANCPYCGEMHSPLYRCDAAMAKKPVAKTEMAKKPMAKTTYRYRDPDKRRAYMRELMRKRYAARASGA
jgi:hypothetical protein